MFLSREGAKATKDPGRTYLYSFGWSGALIGDARFAQEFKDKHLERIFEQNFG